MKQSLQLKVTQHLTLTPQLQQSIRLLQLSTLELQQEIEQALTDNPLLELSEEEHNPGTITLSLDSNSELGEQYNPPPSAPNDTRTAPEATPDSDEPPSTDRLDQFEADWTGEWRDHSGVTSEGDEEKPGLQLAAPESTLHKHLLDQLILTNASERDKNLVLWLIDYLNDDGYLTVELEDLWETLQEEPDLEFEELHAALKLLQSFDPIGVGARNAAECLLTQLHQAQHPTYSAEDLALSETIIREHLNLLAQRDYNKLKKALSATDTQIKTCQALIRSLEPFPGARFRTIEESHITPDVLVKKIKGKWQAQINPDIQPRLQINEIYATILRSHRGQCVQLSGQLQEARWFIKNIQQRFDTILRVSQAIIEQQTKYFNEGATAMKPLVLREIADLLNLHESTISRVTTQKYMLTPYGLVELKYFFGSHVSTENGGQASSTAIRAQIKNLISSEDPKQPLSDSQIADLMGQQGIVVARRTVAKYRELLKIPPVNMRKSI